MSLLTLFFAALLIGIVLFAIGWRGKRIDDHPLCRRCSYDLVGTVELPAKCPECGSTLNNHRATRIGNRRRRRAMFTVGMVISLSSLTCGGLFSWSKAKDFDWYPYKPLWMLQTEIENDPSVGGARKATAEILRRLGNDKLSNRQVRNLVDHALDLQADPNANWNRFWGDLIEEAWIMGRTLDDKLKQYFQELFNQRLSFKIASRARPIEWTLFYFRFKECRGSSGKWFRAVMETGLFRLDGVTFSDRQGRSVINVGDRSGSGHGSNLEMPDLPGKYTLTAVCRIWVYPYREYDAAETPDMSNRDGWDRRKRLAACDWSQSFDTPIEIVAPDGPIVDLVEDESLYEQIRKSIAVRTCSLFARNDRMSPNCWIEFDSPPIAVSFDVYWRIGDKAWLVQTIACDKQGNDSSVFSKVRPKMEGFPLDARAVDVVFRSNPEYANTLVAAEQLWVGEDIVIANRPLDIERRN